MHFTNVHPTHHKQFAGSGAVLHRDEVVPLLMEQYRPHFLCKRPSSALQKLEAIPIKDKWVQKLGQYTSLQGYDSLIKQVWRRLRRLQCSFISGADFERSLQLLRLVAAPGLGKVLLHAKQGCTPDCTREISSYSQVCTSEIELVRRPVDNICFATHVFGF